MSSVRFYNISFFNIISYNNINVKWTPQFLVFCAAPAAAINLYTAEQGMPYKSVRIDTHMFSYFGIQRHALALGWSASPICRGIWKEKTAQRERLRRVEFQD